MSLHVCVCSLTHHQYALHLFSWSAYLRTCQSWMWNKNVSLSWAMSIYVFSNFAINSIVPTAKYMYYIIICFHPMDPVIYPNPSPWSWPNSGVSASQWLSKCNWNNVLSNTVCQRVMASSGVDKLIWQVFIHYQSHQLVKVVANGGYVIFTLLVYQL